MRPGARLRRKAGFGKRLAPPVGPVSWQLVSCWQTLAPHSAGGLHRPSLYPGTASLSLSNCRAIVGRAFLFGALPGRPGGRGLHQPSLYPGTVSLSLSDCRAIVGGFSVRGFVRQAGERVCIGPVFAPEPRLSLSNCRARGFSVRGSVRLACGQFGALYMATRSPPALWNSSRISASSP